MDDRKDPELLLRQAQAEERLESAGRLKIFLGYSSRVGKSYRMLDEGRRRAARGQDVVVGAVQSPISPDIKPVLAQLEVIPMLAVEGKEVMDVAAIVARRPQICLIDGLAYTNPPAWPCAERWQQADVLLAAGISIVSSINLQFVAERQREVEAILGSARGGPLVPASFLHRADEIEVVDAPPDACGHGDLRQLTELREIALLLAADVVDRQLAKYLRRNGIEPGWGTQERILLCLGESPASTMIASGRRNADRFHGELIAVHVGACEPGSVAARNLEEARAAGAETVRRDGTDYVAAVADLARERGVTQIFVVHPRLPARRWSGSWRRGPLDRLLAHTEGTDVRIFPREDVPMGNGRGDA